MRNIAAIQRSILGVICLLATVGQQAIAQPPATGMGNLQGLEQIDPNNIPDEATLRQIGVSEEQIKKLMQTKQKVDPVVEVTDPGKIEDISVDTIPQSELVVRDVEGLPAASVYGQDFFRNKELNYFERASDIKASEDYILGVGDEVTIAVWGFSNYNQKFTIRDNGAIDPPGVGRMYLKGLTFAAARSLITRKYASYLNLGNSEIDISLNYSRVITVNIVGEVFSPGSYTIPAVNTAFNALVAANGPSQIGSVRDIRILRNGKMLRSLDLYAFLLDPNSKENFFLQDNDYLLVPPAGRVVAVAGQVRRPHNYELKAGEQLLKLIDYAGGLTASAYRENVQVRRFKNNKEVVIDVDLDSLRAADLDYELQDGDQLLFREIPDGLKNYVTIQGAVRLPGNYELRKGDKLSDIIERAEGFEFNAYLDQAYVIRTNADLSREFMAINLKNVAKNMVLQEFDEIRVFSNEEFTDQFKVSIFGAVRKPGDFIFGEGLTLQDIIYLGGGLKVQAANTRIEISRILNLDEAAKTGTPTRTTIESISIDKNLKIDKASAGFKMEPFDQVFVRAIPEFELQRNVQLVGEVNYPGTYSLLDKEEKLLSVIERAGGLTNWAFLEGAVLYREEAEVGHIFMDLKKALKSKSSSFNYILKEGDIITIPKVNELVAVGGAVNYPHIDTIGTINAPFHSGRSAKYYVKEYGVGFAKRAKRRGTYVRGANGVVSRSTDLGFIRFYPKVEKGATIIVPVKAEKIKNETQPKEPIDWNRQIEGAITKATAILTIWLLVDRINAN